MNKGPTLSHWIALHMCRLCKHLATTVNLLKKLDGRFNQRDKLFIFAVLNFVQQRRARSLNARHCVHPARGDVTRPGKIW